MIYMVISLNHLYPMNLDFLISSHCLYHIIQWCPYKTRLSLYATCKDLHSLTPEFKDLSTLILRRMYGSLFRRRIEEMKRPPSLTPDIKHRQIVKNRIAEELERRKAPFFYLEVCFIQYIIPYPPAQEAMVYTGLGDYDNITIPAHGELLFLHIDITDRTRFCDVYLLSSSPAKTTILKVFSSSRSLGSWSLGRKKVLQRIPLDQIYVQTINWFTEHKKLQG